MVFLVFAAFFVLSSMNQKRSANKISDRQHNKNMTTSQKDVRERHAEIQKRRAELIVRLSAQKEPACEHPSYKVVSTLLNNTFGKSSLAQRPAVLAAAAWLINLIERQIAADSCSLKPPQQNNRLF